MSRTRPAQNGPATFNRLSACRLLLRNVGARDHRSPFLDVGARARLSPQASKRWHESQVSACFFRPRSPSTSCGTLLKVSDSVRCSRRGEEPFHAVTSKPGHPPPAPWAHPAAQANAAVRLWQSRHCHCLASAEGCVKIRCPSGYDFVAVPRRRPADREKARGRHRRPPLI